MTKKRTAIPQLQKVRALLQQEIKSRCPFCPSEEVGHFQIHHIDENPSNHRLNNLLLVCPSCHSKISKYDILKSEVEQKKRESSTTSIEIGPVKIVKSKCSWIPIPRTSNAFCIIESDRHINPVFSILLINHSPRTIYLKEIGLRTQHQPIQLAGVPKSYALKTIQRYCMHLPKTGELSSIELDNEIVIPSGQPAKIEVEIANVYGQRIYPIVEEQQFFFSLITNQETLHLPPIFINCTEIKTVKRLVLID